MAKKKPTPTPNRPAPSAQSPARPRAAAQSVRTAVPKVSNALSGPALWWGLAAAALGFLVYLNTWNHTYVLDDYSIIKSNWVVKGGLKHLSTIFSTEYRYGSWNSPGSLYRPLSVAIFALQWQMAPDQPWLGHVTNILFFAFTGWILWITWRRILADYPAVLALIAVLLFMAHPVHTEVVANIKSLDEILALLFSTAAMYAIWRYLSGDGQKWRYFAPVLYFFGLLSKEGAFMFVFIFPLTLWFFTQRSWGDIARIALLMLAPALLFLLIRYQVLSSQTIGKEVYSVLDNFIVEAKDWLSAFASACMMCGRYLYALVFPHPLVSDLGYPQYQPVTFSDWRAWAGLLPFAFMTIWAFWKTPSKHFLAYAILFFLLNFALYSNVLVKIGTSYGERLLYTPSFGFTLVLGWLLVKIFPNVPKEAPRLNQLPVPLVAIVGLLLLAYSAKGVWRNQAWYNSNSLYEADIINSPNCAKLNYHRSLEIVQKGLIEETGVVTDTAWVKRAIESYDRTIELYPVYHDAYGSRGVAYFRLGDFDKAMRDYRLSLKYRGGNATVLSNMGFIYLNKLNRLDSA